MLAPRDRRPLLLVAALVLILVISVIGCVYGRHRRRLHLEVAARGCGRAAATGDGASDPRPSGPVSHESWRHQSVRPSRAAGIPTVRRPWLHPRCSRRCPHLRRWRLLEDAAFTTVVAASVLVCGLALEGPPRGISVVVAMIAFSAVDRAGAAERRAPHPTPETPVRSTIGPSPAERRHTP